LTPEIGYIPIGSVLDVEGTISADRRYVTMTVRPTVTRLVSLTGFPIQTSTGSTTSQAFIQLPVVAIQEMATTVSVPDRGTLLLGGQRQAAQFEREQGVPLLSKVPVVNRLFTNRGMVRDEQTLLILVKPTIIINRESEEEAFPGLANMP
jgi:type II secretory pathway component GspD/PulD (secretin)